MNVSPPANSIGTVASLHIHGAESGAPMLGVSSFNLVAGQGIAEDLRYFARISRSGRPARRQVTLIEREQIAEHAVVLGLESIAPGAVRSNVETLGIDLERLLGEELSSTLGS